MDSSDPIESWSIEPILAGKVKHGIPKEDLYGHLHFHVRDKLEAFGRRIADLQIRFNLYCMDAAALPNVLPTCPRFDRVEVANMTDLPYLGLNTTLTVCGPLLKSPDENPHATLITMFMNAAELAERDLGQVYTRRQMKPGMEKARKFMPITPDMLVPNTSGAPAAIRMACAHNLFRDYDGLFAHYMDIFHFKDAGEAACLRIKDAHTIIDQWPMRLKKKFGEPGAQREFDLLMQSNSLGNERYVEWARER